MQHVHVYQFQSGRDVCAPHALKPDVMCVSYDVIAFKN